MRDKKNIEGKIFTANQAAEYLGLSLSYLYKLTYGHVLPFFKPNGKKIYFLEADLKSWLTRKRVAPICEVEQKVNKIK